MSYLKQNIKFIGPGLLMAGAAIGVSHLIQSTRAGADFGFSLLGLILLVNVLKYPFFEFGHRYAPATNENLLQGYFRLGKHFLYTFLVLNIITAVISIAGVTYVTASLVTLLLPNGFNTLMVSYSLMLICAGLIVIGHYKLLDKIMKWLMIILFITTITAFAVALNHKSIAPSDFQSVSPWTYSTLPFLIALMGWMPAPIELSVWQSLWVQAKNRTLHQNMTLHQSRFDFNLGYIMTIMLALIFVALGALTMHGSNLQFSDSGSIFASQLIAMYTSILGEWTKPIVIISALGVMFSTTLTVIDAYPRSLAAGMKIAFNPPINHRILQCGWVILTCCFALWLIHAHLNHFKKLIDLAATISFIAAPLFAYLNVKLIFSSYTPKDAQPKVLLKFISILGLIFLTGFCVFFIIHFITVYSG